MVPCRGLLACQLREFRHVIGSGRGVLFLLAMKLRFAISRSPSSVLLDDHPQGDQTSIGVAGGRSDEVSLGRQDLKCEQAFYGGCLGFGARPEGEVADTRRASAEFA